MAHSFCPSIPASYRHNQEGKLGAYETQIVHLSRYVFVIGTIMLLGSILYIGVQQRQVIFYCHAITCCLVQHTLQANQSVQLNLYLKRVNYYNFMAMPTN